ncbi:dehydration-responsive element-binding protein 1B-like [Rutidosis leptorrhynchoides]|uniref:dehydration-responsive element-binding protein 1B-like n=1 Tax=Rutidosis leptorrhynchoides TaxID=125765 RepID=UPI003A9900DE
MAPKQLSGYAKRKRKIQDEEMKKSQAGVLFQLQLLKNYLRSTMSQQRLSGLAMKTIENEILENMEIIEDDGFSSSTTTSSSSSSSQTEIRNSCVLTSKKFAKRKSARKRFKETRNPVCEIHEPSKQSRIWLGTFQTPEMAARAYDAATVALPGDNSPVNFFDSARQIRRAKSCSLHDIQEADLEEAYSFGSKLYNNKTCSLLSLKREEDNDDVVAKVEETASFIDEEAMFNMPSFYTSMAEGLVITPPGMKKGFDWDDDYADCNMDLTLWTY